MLNFVWYILPCVFYSFATILTRKREMVALLLLSFLCLVTVKVQWLFLTVPWLGLQCVTVVFPDHTYLILTAFYRTAYFKGQNIFQKV